MMHRLMFAVALMISSFAVVGCTADGDNDDYDRNSDRRRDRYQDTRSSRYDDDRYYDSSDYRRDRYQTERRSRDDDKDLNINLDLDGDK